LRPYSISCGKCSSFMADSLSKLFVVLFISVEWQIVLKFELVSKPLQADFQFGFVCCPLVHSSIFTSLQYPRTNKTDIVETHDYILVNTDVIDVLSRNPQFFPLVI
jgi:hypothetical protein